MVNISYVEIRSGLVITTFNFCTIRGLCTYIDYFVFDGEVVTGHAVTNYCWS